MKQRAGCIINDIDKLLAGIIKVINVVNLEALPKPLLKLCLLFRALILMLRKGAACIPFSSIELKDKRHFFARR